MDLLLKKACACVSAGECVIVLRGIFTCGKMVHLSVGSHMSLTVSLVAFVTLIGWFGKGSLPLLRWGWE